MEISKDEKFIIHCSLNNKIGLFCTDKLEYKEIILKDRDE